MIAIQIDANLVHNENGEIYISTSDAENFKLSEGEKILVYEGCEIWHAIVHSFISENKRLWYIQLSDIYGTMNSEQKEWNYTGYINGYYTGIEVAKKQIINQMISKGYCFEDIEKVISMNEELKDKVKKILLEKQNHS